MKLRVCGAELRGGQPEAVLEASRSCCLHLHCNGTHRCTDMLPSRGRMPSARFSQPNVKDQTPCQPLQRLPALGLHNQLACLTMYYSTLDSLMGNSQYSLKDPLRRMQGKCGCEAGVDAIPERGRATVSHQTRRGNRSPHRSGRAAALPCTVLGHTVGRAQHAPHGAR